MHIRSLAFSALLAQSVCGAATAQPQCTTNRIVGSWAFTEIGWTVPLGSGSGAVTAIAGDGDWRGHHRVHRQDDILTNLCFGNRDSWDSHPRRRTHRFHVSRDSRNHAGLHGHPAVQSHGDGDADFRPVHRALLILRAERFDRFHVDSERAVKTAMDRQLHTAGAHAGARGMASGFPLTCNEGAKPYVQYA